MENQLELNLNLPLHHWNAGLQISRGGGRHMDRNIDCFDLLFVREGVLPIQEEQQAFRVSAGQTLILYPGRRHWGTADFSADMRMYWLHFSLLTPVPPTPPLALPHQKVEGSSQQLRVPQYTTVQRPDVLESFFRRYLDDQESGRLLQTSGDLLLHLILSEIADQRSQGTSDRTSAVLAGRALQYIRSHLNSPLTASIVAYELGYNPEYLNRIFHQQYRHTLTQEIHLSRIGYARYMLLNSSKSIKEIALECGFQDTNYFTRLFKRYEGITAMAFRRIHAQAEINYE